MRLGDRIAVMRQGGHLEQYDTPARDPRRAGHGLRRGVRRRRPRAQAPRCDTDRGATTSSTRPVVHLDDRWPTRGPPLSRSRARWARRPRRPGRACTVGVASSGLTGRDGRATALAGWRPGSPRRVAEGRRSPTMLQHDAGLGRGARRRHASSACSRRRRCTRRCAARRCGCPVPAPGRRGRGARFRRLAPPF